MKEPEPFYKKCGKVKPSPLMKKISAALLILILAIAACYYLFPEKVASYMIDYARSRAGLVKKNIRVGDHDIVYLEGGKGKTILLLHGYGSEKDAWLLFAAHLTKNYHVLIPDIPGHGESSQLAQASYSLTNQVERLHKFADRLGLTSFHIAGNSMGGLFAGIYAARYPKEIASLGLFNAAGVKPPHFSEVFRLMNKGENPLVLKNENDYDRLMGLVFYNVPQVPYPVKYVSIKKALACRRFNEKMLHDLRADIFSLEKELPKIEAPGLIMWGDADKIIDISSVAVLEKGLARHETVILKNCGHAPMAEKAEEAAAGYRDFLQSVKN